MTNRYFGDIIVSCFVLPEFVSEVITVSFGGGAEVFTGFFSVERSSSSSNDDVINMYVAAAR